MPVTLLITRLYYTQQKNRSSGAERGRMFTDTDRRL